MVILNSADKIMYDKAQIFGLLKGTSRFERFSKWQITVEKLRPFCMLSLCLLVSSTDNCCKPFGTANCRTRPRGYKTFFMLNSTENKILTSYKN